MGNSRESLKPTLSMGNDEDAADVNEASISWIRRHAHEDNRPLHVNYWDPHTDYGEPREWVQRTGEAAPRQDGPARARLSAWWHQYAGVPGAFPDSMQTTLAKGRPSSSSKSNTSGIYATPVGRFRS